MRRGPSKRGLAVGLPSVALATVGGVWVQARRVAHAPLPHFEDLDPSGTYGSTSHTSAGDTSAGHMGTSHVGSGHPLRIVALGDSSLTGPGLVDVSDTWIAQVAASQERPVELRSLARGGSRVADVLAHQLPAAQALDADVFLTSVGANDAMHGTPSAPFRRNLRTLLTSLAEIAPVISLGVGDLSVIPRLPRSLRPIVSVRSSTIDRLHRQVTSAVDGVTRVPVRELSDPRFRAGGVALFSPDLFHPNAAGHQIWAELFTPYLAATIATMPVPSGA